MKLNYDVLIKLIQLFREGITNNKDISQMLRDLDVEVQKVDGEDRVCLKGFKKENF